MDNRNTFLAIPVGLIAVSPLVALLFFGLDYNGSDLYINSIVIFLISISMYISLIRTSLFFGLLAFFFMVDHPAWYLSNLSENYWPSVHFFLTLTGINYVPVGVLCVIIFILNFFSNGIVTGLTGSGSPKVINPLSVIEVIEDDKFLASDDYRIIDPLDANYELDSRNF